MPHNTSSFLGGSCTLQGVNYIFFFVCRVYTIQKYSSQNKEKCNWIIVASEKPNEISYFLYDPQEETLRLFTRERSNYEIVSQGEKLLPAHNLEMHHQRHRQTRAPEAVCLEPGLCADPHDLCTSILQGTRVRNCLPEATRHRLLCSGSRNRLPSHLRRYYRVGYDILYQVWF